MNKTNEYIKEFDEIIRSVTAAAGKGINSGYTIIDRGMPHTPATLKRGTMGIYTFLSWDKDFNEEIPISDAQIDSYLDELVIGINYPEELQLLERKEGKKKKQTKCESIVVGRDIAQDYVYTKKNNDKIVYTDDGDTLSELILDSTLM